MTHKKLNAFLLIDPDDFLDELVTNLGLINDVADAQDNLQGNPVFPHFIKPYSRLRSRMLRATLRVTRSTASRSFP